MADNKNNIVKSSLDDYESVYKIDLNFDADVSGLTPDVIYAYITRVLANHPYYVDSSQIVDLIVDETKNVITVIVSDKEVSDRLNDISNSTIDLKDVTEEENIYNYENNTNDEILNNINKMYPTTEKYILDYETPEGESYLYEYDFDGFAKAKTLMYNKNIILNGNKKRHFLKNSNDNPYYYDEYVNNVNNVNIMNQNKLDPNNPSNVKNKIFDQNIPNITEQTIDNINISEAVNSTNSVTNTNSVTGTNNLMINSVRLNDNTTNNNVAANNVATNNNGATNNGAANNGVANNVAANNVAANNGAANNGAANNGVANNGAANNVAANNGAANNGVANNQEVINMFIIFAIIIIILVIMYILFKNI